MQKKVIAISDITSFGLSEFEQKRFFNRLESELVNINQYTVTNRAEVDKILAEQKFQNSGCTDSQCAAEIGRILNADLMLLADVLYDESSGDVSVTYKIVNVESAKITTSLTVDENVEAIKDISNNVYGYLMELYRKDSLINQSESVKEVTTNAVTQKADVGWVSVSIIPPESKIVINNQPYKNPVSYLELNTGKNFIKVSNKHYRTLKQSININPDELTEINKSLIPMSVKKARIRSLIWPGLGHLYAERPLKSLFFFGASAIGFLGSIGNSHYLTTQVIPDVNSSYDAYVASGFEEVEEKKSVYLAHLDNKNRVITNILYFSGLYLTSQIISFWDLGKIIPSDNSSLEFNVKEDQALLEYRFGF